VTALGKAVLLIARSIENILFHLRYGRVLLCDYTRRGCTQSSLLLSSVFEACLARSRTKRAPYNYIKRDSGNASADGGRTGAFIRNVWGRARREDE